MGDAVVFDYVVAALYCGKRMLPVFFLPLEWIQQYSDSLIQQDKLQKVVDSFMEDYDKRKEEVRILLLFLQDHTHKHLNPVRLQTVFCVSGSGAAEEQG